MPGGTPENFVVVPSVLRKITNAWAQAREYKVLTKTGTGSKGCAQRRALIRGGIVPWLAVGLFAVLQASGHAALGQSAAAGKADAAASPLSGDPRGWAGGGSAHEL